MQRDQGQKADANLATTNAAATTAGNTANQVFGVEMPAINNQINPDPATRSAFTQEPINAVNSAYDTAASSATNRLAKTRNSAGFSGSMDRLARDRASSVSDATMKGTQAVAGLQQQGIQNASNLYGVNNDTMRSLYGLGPSTLNARAQGVGGDQVLTGTLNSIAQFGGATKGPGQYI